MAIQFGSTAVSAIKYRNASGVLQDVTSVVRNGAIVWSAAPTENYLTFTANTAGSEVTFAYASGSNVMYRQNGGTWAACPSGTVATLASVGDTVQYKGSNVTTDGSSHFVITGSVAGSGSVTSLTDGVGTDENVSLTQGCYVQMFTNCTGLTTAPAIVAKTTTTECYMAMFANSGITNVPSLPATVLADECYMNMFNGCASLTGVPTLPAMTLGEYCYESMFYYSGVTEVNMKTGCGYDEDEHGYIGYGITINYI